MKNKKKIKIALLLVVVIMLLLLVLFVVKYQQKQKLLDTIEISFHEEITTIEYGTSFDTSSLVASTNGEVKEYPALDTKELGKHTLTFLVEKEGIEKKATYEIEVKDTQAPEISFKTDSLQIIEGTDFHADDNIISIKDPVDGDIPKQGEKADKPSYTITSNVDTSTSGTYQVVITATDKNGNKSEASYSVIVSKKASGTPTYANEDPSTIHEPTYINGILLVNKAYPLPVDYGNGIDDMAYAALQNLQTGALEAGFDIPMVSGYRSYTYQEGLYNAYVARDGQAAADRYSARPGHSEHQTGLAFDVGAIDNYYGETPAGKWLAAHAHEYGFIIRYPQGKEHITGYMYEPWHIRYLGDVAKKVYESGLTLEEYLGVY